ncbi:hypothetical protein Peur_055144 [Populus x canadensis]
MVLKLNGTIGIPFADYSGFPSYSKAEDVAATFLTLISNIQALIFFQAILSLLAVWAMPPAAAQDSLLARWKFLRSHGLNLQPNAWLYGLTLRSSGCHTDTVSTVPSKAPPTSHTYTPSKFKLPNGVLRILYANHRPLH